MSERKRVSSEVAEQLSITRKNLLTYLTRHPELRPSERLPNGDFLWSEDEIKAVVECRENRGKSKK